MRVAQRTLFAATLLTIFSASITAQDVTIIYTNDLHTHVDSYKVPYITGGKRDIDGFTNISMLVEQEKVKDKATFYFDAGDYFTGPYTSSLTKDEAIIDIINTMPSDAVSIGNHKFDYGWDNALRQLSKANFPVLSDNVYHKKSEKPLQNKPYTVLEKDSIKISIVGLHGILAFNDTVSELSLQELGSDNSNRFDKSSVTLKNQGIEARDEVKYLQHYIDELRDRVDLTVALIHESVPARQSSIGNTDVGRMLDKGIQAASKVKGLDILITGRAYTGTPEPVKADNILILSTDSGGVDIGELILDVNPTARTHRVKSFELKTVYVDEWTPDPATQRAINGWNKKLADLVRRPAGESSTALTRTYGRSSQLGSLSTGTMFVATLTAQIALINSGNLRADVNVGTITSGDITSTFPFKNELTEMDLNGEDLRNLLEHGAPLTNGVLQMSKGTEVRYTLQKPVDQRTVPFRINGEEVANTNIYHVATTAFLVLGGDGFLTFKEGKNIQVCAENNISNVVIDYFKKGHKITPAQVNEVWVEVSK